MRDLKCRGKRTDTGTWIEGYYIHLHETTYCCTGSKERDRENEIHQIVFEQMTDWGLRHLRADVDPETVCQKVGPFFEGDIIDYMGARFLIEYDPATQAFIGRSLERNSFVPLSKHIVELSDVIGNRWDNPELLTK